MSKAKYSVKYSPFTNCWYVYLPCFGQFGETYETKAKATEVANYYNNQVLA